jgi:hypothetical protein
MKKLHCDITGADFDASKLKDYGLEGNLLPVGEINGKNVGLAIYVQDGSKRGTCNVSPQGMINALHLAADGLAKQLEDDVTKAAAKPAQPTA